MPADVCGGGDFGGMRAFVREGQHDCQQQQARHNGRFSHGSCWSAAQRVVGAAEMQLASERSLIYGQSIILG